MTRASNLGFPRIGPDREMKKALEGYWVGRTNREELERVGRELRRQNWQMQKEAGIEQIPSNDFSLYDQMLDVCAMVGAVPTRYGWSSETVDLETYFHMARGKEEKEGSEIDVIAMEMTKWFDTNYHYIVPEFEEDQQFRLASSKPIDEFREALEVGIRTRPVIVGPVSFLLLGKSRHRGLDRLTLLDRLVPIYGELLRKLAEAGAEWVQLDEPCLALDLDDRANQAYEQAYGDLTKAAGNPKILLVTYFGGLRDNMPLATKLPVHGLHVDLVREPQQLDDVLNDLPDGWVLSAGVVDGRNIWKNNLEVTLQTLHKIKDRIGVERLWIAPSCSLTHVPIDLALEEGLNDEFKGWLAFARQKLDEVAALTRGLNEGPDVIHSALEASRKAIESRKQSARVNIVGVQQRVAGVRSEHTRRRRPFAQRKPAQHGAMNQPLMPTTTIGSFPQTAEVRKQRSAFRKGEITREQYETFLEGEIENGIRFQERIGLDVLVHGEPERNDMVQYFGEQLTGIAFTQHGWVQSYGSRYVRPPIIYGDVARPQPMTLRWAKYAQSLTDKPVKGMLTGPVTILQWSFVRDDQSRSQTCRQIALAIRDEVMDLEAAGIRAIQIDEPAMREGLPLRRSDWNAYLQWAVECFRLVSSGVKDETQIHTHMCYSEFDDIIDAIGDMDADVIAIEASRSRMELLEAFAEYKYPNEIGPGVYDIHSPRVPSVEEMHRRLEKVLQYLSADQVWVNPDCGLKTRNWDEVQSSLKHMVEAARLVRARLAEQAAVDLDGGGATR